MMLRRPVRRHRGLGQRGGPARRRRGADAVRRRRCSRRGSCGRWRRSPGGRSSALRGLTGRLARENAMRKPGPHGHHGRGADDRPRAGRVRDGLRRRDQQLDRQDDRRQLPRRDRAPEHRRLLADSRATRSTRPRASTASQTVSSITLRHRRARRAATGASSSPASTRATLGEVLALDFQSGGSPAFAGARRRRRRSSTRTSRDDNDLERGRHAARAHADRASGRRSTVRRHGRRASSTCSARWSSTRATTPASSAGSSPTSRSPGSRRRVAQGRRRRRWTTALEGRASRPSRC